MTTQPAVFKTGDFIIPKENTFPEGMLRVKDITDKGFRAFAEGGGFIYHFKPSAYETYRTVTEEERNRPRWDKGMFGLDEGPDYEGYTNHRLWNGFEQPYFEREVVKQIIRDLGGRWNEETGIGQMPDETGSFESMDSGDACLVEGEMVEGLGKMLWTFSGWCWSKA